MPRFFTSESVTEGHPDKVCDQIADAILDETLRADPDARVACEVAASSWLVLAMGEITARERVPVERIARDTIVGIGYRSAEDGFDGNACAVLSSVNRQSGDIAMGVDRAGEIGAGDQGMMFGYACDETEELMPMPIQLAHRLTRALAEKRKSGELAYLRPDGKAQVTVEYVGGKPARVDCVIVSAQHAPDVERERLAADVERRIIRASIPANLLDDRTRFLVNPTGRFVVGGPQGDSGVTGRKIIVDTYGGCARHGGGAFSGKDPTKVDRSASYAARYAALNVVAAKLASRCEIQLSYAIGVARPVSIAVETFGTGKLSDEALCGLIETSFDFRPAAIIERFGLRRPMYSQVSVYGHFGRGDLRLPWESRDSVETLLRFA